MAHPTPTGYEPVQRNMPISAYLNTCSNTCTTSISLMQDTNNIQEENSDAVRNNNKEDIKINQFDNGNHNKQTDRDWVTTEVLEVINSCFQNEMKTMIDDKLSVILQTLEQL